jgi:glutathione S-transferase
MLYAQGTGRLPVEVMVTNVASDLRAVATLLGDAPFLGGDRPCTADVTLLAVSWSLEACPADTALRRVWSAEPAIVAHLARMRARLYPDACGHETEGARG